MRNAKKAFFCIHTPPDPRTAVFIGANARKEYFEKRGYDVEVISPWSFTFLGRYPRLIPVLYPFFLAFMLLRAPFCHLVQFHSYSGWVFNAVRKISPRTRETYSVTSFHGLEPLFFAALEEESRLRGRPLTLRFRIFYMIFLNGLMKLTTKFSDSIICLNFHEKEFLLQSWKISPEKIHQCANEVAESFFIERDYPERARALLFSGQWLMMKGISYWCKAVEKLAKSFPDMEFHMAGTLQNETRIRKDFSSSVQKQIRVYEHSDRHEMMEHYRNADILVATTLSEGFNRSLFEAMATGMPVITTDAGAAGDLIKDHENGLLIPMRDPDAIVAAVTELVGNRELRRKVGANARKKAKELMPEKVMMGWFKACGGENV